MSETAGVPKSDETTRIVAENYRVENTGSDPSATVGTDGKTPIVSEKYRVEIAGKDMVVELAPPSWLKGKSSIRSFLSKWVDPRDRDAVSEYCKTEEIYHTDELDQFWVYEHGLKSGVVKRLKGALAAKEIADNDKRWAVWRVKDTADFEFQQELQRKRDRSIFITASVLIALIVIGGLIKQHFFP